MNADKGRPKAPGPRSRLEGAILLLTLIFCLLLVILALLPDTGRRPQRGGPATAAQGAAPARPAPQESPVPRRPALPQREGSPAPTPEAGGRIERPEKEARLAVVIDDVGYNLKELESFLQLPLPLAFAVLPRLEHSREAARLIREAGKTLLLHCPMEPMNGEDPGPGTLFTAQSPQEMEKVLEEDLAEVPGAVGVNNHMGSRLTADRSAMRTVLSVLKRKGLFFLDSRTTPDSVAMEIARELGVTAFSRDAFLDNERSRQYIEQAFANGLALARQQGGAVLIGHVHSLELAAQLRDLQARLSGQGGTFVPLGEVAP